MSDFDTEVLREIGGLDHLAAEVPITAVHASRLLDAIFAVDDED